MININMDIPNWADIIQAFAALIAVPVTIFTLYKLVSRDKERESEINSLSQIAGQLSQIASDNEIRHKASKKPYFNIKVQTDIHRKRINIEFENTNINTSITQVQLTNHKDDFAEFSAITTSINSNNGRQYFSIVLSCKGSLFEFANLGLDYTTEEGYVFVQDLILMFDNDHYVISPSPIIDKVNSRIF